MRYTVRNSNVSFECEAEDPETAARLFVEAFPERAQETIMIKAVKDAP